MSEQLLYDSKEYWQSTAVTAFRMLLEEYGRRKEAQDHLKEAEEDLFRQLEEAQDRVKELEAENKDLHEALGKAWVGESREVPKHEPMRWQHILKLDMNGLRTALDEALTERAQLQVDVNELEGENGKLRDQMRKGFWDGREEITRLQDTLQVANQELEVQRKQLVELRASQCKCDDSEEELANMKGLYAAAMKRNKDLREALESALVRTKQI